MKIFLFVLLITSSISIFAKDVYVKGYTRSDGTVVKSHHRSSPDSTVNNNFSTKGNVNPYTGKEGWIDRDNDFSSNTASYHSPEIQLTRHQPISENKNKSPAYYDFLAVLFLLVVVVVIGLTWTYLDYVVRKWIKKTRRIRKKHHR